MLVPAGLLVLILLASISVDSALAYMGQRELQNETAAAANDAATEAIPNSPNGGLQAGLQAHPDPAIAQQIAENTVLHPYSGGLTATDVQTTVAGDTVTVTAQGHVHYIFASAVPGAAHYANIKVQSAAQLQFGN
jgi:uncharacterized membrane protein